MPPAKDSKPVAKKRGTKKVAPVTAKKRVSTKAAAVAKKSAPKVTMSVSFEPDLVKYLEAAARKRGVSITDAVGEVLDVLRERDERDKIFRRMAAERKHRAVAAG